MSGFCEGKMNAFLVTGLAGLLAFLLSPAVLQARRQDDKPNIVFILTDDQDVVLGGLEPMQKAKKILRDQGVFFSNAFVHTPICCPSRSSYLTGNYIHNHGALNNSLEGDCSSLQWQAGAEKKAYPVYAKEAGYQTAYVGKYLNTYANKRAGGVAHIPPGWDHWFALVGNSKYYNYSVSNNGIEEKHGDNYTKDYFTDLIANVSVDFIRQTAANLSNEKPFLLVVAPPAPHAPFTPAPQYANVFEFQVAPRTPNWNVTDKNKHWVVREQAPMDTRATQTSDGIFGHRWETLLSVDDLVERIFNELYAFGLQYSTYIIFASDHGFQLGQFCIPYDKREPYEHDIRIPMMVRGPGVPQNVTIDNIVLNIDIAPTLIDLMGVEPPTQMDGTSFAPLLHGKTPEDWRTDFLIDYHGEGRPPCGLPTCPGPKPEHFHSIDASNNTYTCVRTLSSSENSIYCEFTMTGFVEYYNITADPWQLNNTAHTESAAVIEKHKERLQQLRTCAGPSCRTN